MVRAISYRIGKLAMLSCSRTAVDKHVLAKLIVICIPTPGRRNEQSSSSETDYRVARSPTDSCV